MQPPPPPCPPWFRRSYQIGPFEFWRSQFKALPPTTPSTTVPVSLSGTMILSTRWIQRSLDQRSPSRRFWTTFGRIHRSVCFVREAQHTQCQSARLPLLPDLVGALHPGSQCNRSFARLRQDPKGHRLPAIVSARAAGTGDARGGSPCGTCCRPRPHPMPWAAKLCSTMSWSPPRASPSCCRALAGSPCLEPHVDVLQRDLGPDPKSRCGRTRPRSAAGSSSPFHEQSESQVA